MTKMNILLWGMIFLITPSINLLSKQVSAPQEEGEIPKWISDLVYFAQSKEGAYILQSLQNLLVLNGQLLSHNIGNMIGASAEEIAKGLVRGLTNPAIAQQFTQELNKIFEDFGKEAIGTSGNIIETARKELFKQADAAVDDSLDFTSRTRQKLWDGIFTNFDGIGKDVENDFKKGGRIYQLIQKDAQVVTDAFGDAGAEITDGIKRNFGRNSESYRNIQKTVDDLGYLFQRSIGHLQKGVIFNTFKHISGGVAITMIPLFGIRYIYHYLISKLNDPRIIIETSIGSWPYEYAKWLFRFKPRRAVEKLHDMILSSKIKLRIQELIDFEKAHLKAKEGFDNILLIGNPGTGKTMFAKAIAAELGMDYIVLTGSSFFQENAGIKALDQIFGKLTKGRKVVIFIDEIDSIVSTRVGKNSDSDAYRLLNQLLNYTSTPNKNFILIGATNYPELIDKAFFRRFQHVVEMPLPEYADRVQFLTFAKKKHLIVKDNKHNEQVNKLFSDTIIKDVATQTEGLSYAELQTIIDHIKSAMRLSKDGLTKAIIYKAMEYVKIKENSFKQNFLK